MSQPVFIAQDVSNSNGVNFNSTKIYIFRAIKTQSLYFYALNLHKKQNSIDTKYPKIRYF